MSAMKVYPDVANICEQAAGRCLAGDQFMHFAAPPLEGADAELLATLQPKVDQALARARRELAGPLGPLAKVRAELGPEPIVYLPELGHLVAVVLSLHDHHSCSSEVHRPQRASFARVKNLSRGGAVMRLELRPELRDEWRRKLVRSGHHILLTRGLDRGDVPTWQVEVLGGQPAAIPPAHAPIIRPRPQPADREYSAGMAQHFQGTGLRRADLDAAGELASGRFSVVMPVCYSGVDREGEPFEVEVPHVGRGGGSVAQVELLDLLGGGSMVVNLSSPVGRALEALRERGAVGSVLALVGGTDGVTAKVRTAETVLQSRLAALEAKVSAGAGAPAAAPPGPLPGTGDSGWAPAGA